MTIESAAPTAGDACRVTGVARPSPGSRVRFEVRLPSAARWSGRYYQFGNGGFAGNIDAPTLAEGAARGDAVAATDTGHRADRFDASWAAGNPQAVTDYAWRSIGATERAADAIVRAYYGRAPRRRYFMGCSNGGRMALMAAARWPERWDGVIAGAPANPWTAQFRDFASLQHRLRDLPGAWIGAEKLPAIRAAALAGCPKGTVVYGVALDPPACRFVPGTLLCIGAERADCLSRGQLGTLRRIAAAGYLPAAMAEAEWARWIVNPDAAAQSQLTFARGAERYLLPSATAAALDVGPAALDRYRKRGGRILSYIGWADAVIAPTRGIAFYDAVARRAGGGAATRRFYRLFLVPGMAHCQGGEVPDGFGQSLSAPSLRDDPAHDIRRALEAWVEQGTPPETLVAVRSGVPNAVRTLRPRQ